jgi:fluoride ion exporter CrcB/FEX
VHVRRASTASQHYNAPDSYHNLDGSLAPLSRPSPQHASTFPLEHERRRSRSRRASAASQANYDVPTTYTNLSETTDVSPVQNPHEEPIHHYRSLEQVKGQEQEAIREQKLQRRQSLVEGRQPTQAKYDVSRCLTKFYTYCYLVFFAILGTLARLGLQALTSYPGTPIIFPSIWPNFAGSLVMGFLSEDSMLFREAEPEPTTTDEQNAATTTPNKKNIPLYIGLTTGFCGSLTSFSAFMRDTFLALANDLPSGRPTHESRNGGYSFLAVLAIPAITLSLSLSALFLGAHLAIALAPWMPALPRGGVRTLLDRASVLLGWGCLIGAGLVYGFAPPGGDRGEVALALVYAPLGCVVRFNMSLWLNGRVKGFPVGTFVVNMLGTVVLATAWGLAHSSPGGEGAVRGVRACVVLGAVQDGLCGCLTTVSTLVVELAALRRKHAYVYGGASVLGGLAVVVAVMGSFRWSEGYEWGACG